MRNIVDQIANDKAPMGKSTNEIKIFEGHEVEVLEFNGQVLFNAKHVAEVLEIKNVNDNISRMNENQVVKMTNSAIGKTDIRKMNNAGENFLTESGVYKLVFKSHKPNAEKFTDWIADEVLPQIRKTGKYSKNTESNIEQGLIVVKFIADDLRVSESSRLFMYENYCKDVGVPTGFIPKYTDNGSREQCSATELLKRNGCEIKTVKFNQLLLSAGFLEIKERKSSKGAVKKYKSLTDKGLKYGVNLISNKNQKECQPYYYADTFMELYNMVTMRY